jgi:hypothetical protein
MAGGGGIQHPRGRQLGYRLEQAGDDQGQRKIAAALRRAARQQRVERDAARGAERGRARLFERAATLGRSATADPDLHRVIDTTIVAA